MLDKNGCESVRPPQGLVFRDAWTEADLADLRMAAAAMVGALAQSPEDATTAVLFLAAFESAWADCHHALDVRGLSDLQAVTDAVALESVGGAVVDRVSAARVLRELRVPATAVRVKRPEGFAYYALHPDDVVRAVRDAVPPGAPCALIGVRTIGAALSAFAAASLRARDGTAAVACRFTVRPTGHPFARTMPDVGPDTDQLRKALQAGAERFVVIDEGPGLSGSTFVAVAEWLERAGVPCDRIALVGSAPVPDAARLLVGATRWRRHRYTCVLAAPAPAHTADLSFGRWRDVFARHPVVPGWRSLERRKRLEPRKGGAPTIAKFEGLGNYGRAPHRRLCALGPLTPAATAPDHEGLCRTPFVSGRAPTLGEVMPVFVQSCAARLSDSAFAPTAGGDALEEAVAANAHLEGLTPLPLLTKQRVVVDARVAPDEWVRDKDGRVWKVDAASHGDDHMFPGPTDIAWDVAGFVVEWRLDADARSALLDAHRLHSGDDASARLRAFEMAYAVCRAAFCAMAAASASDADRAALLAARQRYRAHAERCAASG